MKVAFRIDDVTPHMDWEKFSVLAGIFKHYGVKPLMGVIPENRDPELLKLPYREDGWARIKALSELGWMTAQHGLTHVYTTNEPGLLGINRYSEFAGIDYETQLKMLAEGQKILRGQGLFTDIFMAPAHSFDKNTLKALRALGFRYITDGYSLFPYKRGGLKFIPCQASSPRKMPFGLMTVCLHPNTMREDALSALENWLEQNISCVCDYSEMLMTPALGPVSRAMEKAVLAVRSIKKQEVKNG